MTETLLIIMRRRLLSYGSSRRARYAENIARRNYVRIGDMRVGGNKLIQADPETLRD